MRLITKDSIATSVANDYYHAHRRSLDKRAFYHSRITHRDVYEALLKATTVEDVDRIVGNNFWTSNRCNECVEDCDITVEMGGRFGDTNHLCPDCIAKAANLLRTAIDLRENGRMAFLTSAFAREIGYDPAAIPDDTELPY